MHKQSDHLMATWSSSRTSRTKPIPIVRAAKNYQPCTLHFFSLSLTSILQHCCNLRALQPTKIQYLAWTRGTDNFISFFKKDILFQKQSSNNSKSATSSSRSILNFKTTLIAYRFRASQAVQCFRNYPLCLAGGWCLFVLREKYCWLVAGG
jgi:hypothetical protein